jgi:hypothetical protein
MIYGALEALRNWFAGGPVLLRWMLVFLLHVTNVGVTRGTRVPLRFDSESIVASRGFFLCFEIS